MIASSLHANNSRKRKQPDDKSHDDSNSNSASNVDGEEKSCEVKHVIESVSGELYETLLRSLVIEIACGMHRCAKTGSLPYSEIMTPSPQSDLFENNPFSKAALYDNKNASGADVEDLALLDSKKTTQHHNTRMTRSGSSLMNTSGNNSPGTIDEVGISASSALSSSINSVNNQLPPPPAGADVWGRIPPKEPIRSAKCQLCGKSISALRFAPHLDKCMGIGTRSSRDR
mmetsp:Transcript_49106/g.59243  ORF Transcript_49106/g.59243 Transcript_49106/m.59243 type:complete len:229 (-) Transcript_49106:179-865(-)